MDYLINSFLNALQLIITLDRSTFNVVSTTLVVTFYSTFFSTVFGILTAFYLVYFKLPINYFLKVIFNTLLSLPTVVVGLFVYVLIMQSGIFGKYNLLFTKKAIIIGQTILAYPIVVSLTTSALENYDKRLREFLITLGVSPFRLIATIIWEARLGVIIAIITAYGRVVSEVGASMILGGNIKGYTRTITTAIALETSKGEFINGLALGIILLVISLLINIFIYSLRKIWAL
ncbi:MAG: ABC transporter permease [Deferribacterota bacterium]|nr:ABC transporter permease [Deferribacterota bacterium]